MDCPALAEPSLLLSLPGVKRSSGWFQHVPGSVLFLPSQPVRDVLPLFLVGQDIPGDVLELPVELTIIRVAFLESSLYVVNQIEATHLEPRNLTEYPGSFIAPCLVSKHLYPKCVTPHSVTVSSAARNGGDIGT